jgi:RND family efflux transporter MFP subunit
VRVQRIETRKTTAYEEVVGTIRAKLRATLEARLSGRIEEMPVKLGQHVQAGQVVARLHAPEIQARFEQTQAGLQQAEREWNRVKGLFDQQATTRAEYDSADARFAMARAAVAEARAMVDYVEIRAPFEGVVTRKRADVGDLAAPGKALLELEDPAGLQLEADLPEAIAARVQSGSQLAVRVDGITNALTGTVSEIAPAADPVSRTLQVKLDLTASGALRAGQFARLFVPVSENRSLHVPASAVVRRGQMEIVFVVADNQAQLHLVKTGRSEGDECEVLSGLDAGDAVVVEGAAQLADHQPVTLK